MPVIKIVKIAAEHQDFLRDESRRVGEADTISFPTSTEEVREILKIMSVENISVTVQGARTGISGGASPDGGHILNLSQMNKIKGLRYDQYKDTFYLKVQPGVLLLEVREALGELDFDTAQWSENSLKALERLKDSATVFFSPDPTEITASIGGMVACNASGARSFYYGPTRDYVQGLQIVLTDGSTVNLQRGQQQAQGRSFALKLATGRVIKGQLPDYDLPQVKNVAGFYTADDMDLIDLFIGCEGTLGIITEIELKLIPEPETIWGITTFLNREQDAIKFVKALRGEDVVDNSLCLNKMPVAIEFFNREALRLLQKQRAKLSVPVLPVTDGTAIYTEFHGENDDQLAELLIQMAKLIESCGGDNAHTWVARNPQDMERLHAFRHAIPESVNLLIDERRKKDPEITKLGTDMAVPDNYLEDVLTMYNNDLRQEELDAVIFGHIGNNHLHVNILPEDLDDYQQGKKLYTRWAQKIIDWGGTVSAEHGIGKLKIELVKEMFGSEGIKQMQDVKKIFDSENILSSGNLFSM